MLPAAALAARLHLLGAHAGALQQACSLLPLADAAATLTSLGVSSGGSSVMASGPLQGEGMVRSISTTRGIYMGRVFIRENLQKRAAKSSLFTRDNFEFLASNAWSVAACEQVLSAHQASAPPKKMSGVDLVARQLGENISATQSLEQLQGVVTRHAHQMSDINLVAAMHRLSELLLRRDGTPDYAAAALFMNDLAQLLRPKLPSMSGTSLCNVLASFARCRYSPTAEMLQEMLELLMADGGAKLQGTYPSNLAHLLLALTKLTTLQGHWPILGAIRDRVTEQLHQQADYYSRRSQQLAEEVLQLEAELRALDAHTSSLASSSAADAGSSDGASSSSSSSSSDAGASPLLQAQEGVGGTEAAAAAGGAHAQARAQREQLQWAVQAAKQKVASLHDPGQLRPIAVKNTNAYAMCASLLDRANSSSPEYLSALHQWMSQRAALAGLLPAGAVQLWGAAKGQWSKHEGMLAARAASAGAEQAGDGAGSGGSGSGTAHADGGDDADAQQLAAEVAAAAGVGSTEAQLSRLAGFFGPGTLATLADVTVPLVPHMLERELGMLLNALGRLRFANAELVAAVCGAYEALAAAGTPTLLTQATALWAAAQLQRWGDAVLVQPALVSAVAQPDEMTGFVAARVLIATSHMPRDVAAAAEAAVRAELHRRSGARGPAPAAAGGDAAVPLWVSALADSLAGRIAQCRPREIAYILLAYSEIPGVPVHEGLFGAAARHIELHTHTFSQFRDMEMVATAFERMNFRAGLPALEAMQSLTTSMLNGTPGQQ